MSLDAEFLVQAKIEPIETAHPARLSPKHHSLIVPHLYHLGKGAVHREKKYQANDACAFVILMSLLRGRLA
jgi:hypothetical protein